MSTKTKKSKKVFEMNDDYSELDDLAVLGIGEVDKLIYTEAPEPEEDILEPEIKKEQPASLSDQADQVARGLSGAKSGGQVYLVDIRQLEPYPDQPFQPYPPDRLQELAEDIARVGILNPILVRRQGARLQILAGHNRWTAAKLAGLTEVPVLVLEADDDRAILVLTSTNLRQRERLLPSEKAFAYKMQMEALKRQGQRGEGRYNASSFITQQTGDSRMQIHRYIRLTELTPELLAWLDRGKISMTPAVAVSYLPTGNQQYVYKLVREYGASLTIERANALKSLSSAAEDEWLTPEQINDIMLQTGKKKADSDDDGEYVRLKFDRIRDYLPKGISLEEAEAVIVEALMGYNKERHG